MNLIRRTCTFLAWTGLLLACTNHAQAQRYTGPGVTQTEIRIGQTLPYSGPLSVYGAVGHAQAGYFRMLNDKGGINGRKITLISLDDGYNPAKTVEQTRRLVELDDVLLLFSSLGTTTNLAVRKYTNGKKVPQIFLGGGDTAWGDYQNYPWTIGWLPTYRAEAHLYAKHILRTRPNAKVAVLYANDEYGKDYLQGFKEGFGDQAATMIVATASFEWTDPTVDSQLISLQASGADTLFTATGGRQASQAIRKVWDLGWKPAHYTAISAASPRGILAPVGLEKSVGMISAYYAKDPSIGRWREDPAIKEYFEWAKKYYTGDPEDGIATYGYQVAQAMEYVLRKCGDNLSRENVMKVVTSMKDVEFPLLYPGVKVNTSATDYQPIRQFVMFRFDGKEWVPFTELLTGD